MTQKIGILIYGYSEQQALLIKEKLESGLGETIRLFSASGKEQMRIIDILQHGDALIFDEAQDHVLVFLGFTGDQIAVALKHFPRQENLARPIFCGLTRDNAMWDMKSLIEHLKEEHRYWSQQKLAAAEEAKNNEIDDSPTTKIVTSNESIA